jgi:hypothetical protein
VGGEQSSAAVAVVRYVLALVTLAGCTLYGVVSMAVPAAAAAPASYAPPTTAYWAVTDTGQAVSFRTAFYGDMSASNLSSPVVGAAPTPDGRGYWLVAANGGVFSFGSAGFHGSEGGKSLPAPIVGIVADPATGGYWLVGSKGAVYGFGAPTYGSATLWGLVSPIVGMAATQDGLGYWLVAANGGVFSFGDAAFHGSMGGHQLKTPIIGITAKPAGGGYWLYSSDGGIFAFGAAGFHGSMGGQALAAPVTAMSASPDGGGYWLSGRNGAVYAFGDAPFLGSPHRVTGSTPVVGIISTGKADLFPANTTGYDVSKWQCHAYSGEYLPSGSHSFGVTQVSGGAINATQPAGCYAQESNWAGQNQMAYIFMDPLPSAGANQSMSGPAGNCSATNLACQNYNYGWNWARYWVSYAQGQGTDPLVWFLDVETSGKWTLTAAAQTDNSDEIKGALDGLVAAGQVPGVYSDNYQWELITGGHVTAPGLPLWMAGAAGLSQAEAFCGGNYDYDYEAFAGGTVVMAQYVTQYDQDYVCP